LRVLVVTNMYPQEPDFPAFGVFMEDQVESLRKLGVEVDVLFINGRRNKLNYLAAYPRLWNQLRRKKYDILHAHYVFSGLVARAQWSLPVVLTHHGAEVFQTWEKYICRLTKRWYDKLIVVSPEMKERLAVEDARVIPCGVDMDRFRPSDQMEARRVLGLPSDRKLILWAGEYFRPEKRFDLVREAVNIAASRDDRVKLVLLSGKPHREVPQYMSASDALLLTSDAEGSPMVIKEAMACNLPIVSTPVGDVRQVIGGVEGCYICSQDPLDVAAKLEMAIAFDRRTNGRQRVSRLELSKIAREILEVYEQTIRDFKRDRPRSPSRVRSE